MIYIFLSRKNNREFIHLKNIIVLYSWRSFLRERSDWKLSFSLTVVSNLQDARGYWTEILVGVCRWSSRTWPCSKLDLAWFWYPVLNRIPKTQPCFKVITMTLHSQKYERRLGITVAAHIKAENRVTCIRYVSICLSRKFIATWIKLFISFM